MPKMNLSQKWFGKPLTKKERKVKLLKWRGNPRKNANR